MEIPKGHQAVMPYLILNNANRFIDFTKKVFNAKLTSNTLREDKSVMHAEIEISGAKIMLAEVTPEYAARNGDFFIYVENADESYEKALANGASSKMELSNQSYGRTCGVTDTSGNVWWITSVLPG